MTIRRKKKQNNMAGKKIQEEIKEKAKRQVVKKAAGEKQQKKTTISSQVAVVSTMHSTQKKNAQSALETQLFTLSGKAAGMIALPKEIFGAKINPSLMAQAVRVYLANQRKGSAATKTRGEVTGSTRKIYRQKGTGRARHGGIRAPIFVHGGIAHGPKKTDHSLLMPKKMKRAALFSALSAKLKDGEIKIVQGLEEIEMKTKIAQKVLRDIQVSGKVLLVMPKQLEHVFKAARNIKGVSVISADRINTYELLEHRTVVFMQDAIQTLERVFGKEKKEK